MAVEQEATGDVAPYDDESGGFDLDGLPDARLANAVRDPAVADLSNKQTCGGFLVGSLFADVENEDNCS